MPFLNGNAPAPDRTFGVLSQRADLLSTGNMSYLTEAGFRLISYLRLEVQNCSFLPDFSDNAEFQQNATTAVESFRINSKVESKSGLVLTQCPPGNVLHCGLSTPSELFTLVQHITRRALCKYQTRL
jgi:hypothetical protein